MIWLEGEGKRGRYLRESGQPVVGKVEDGERLCVPGLCQGPAHLPRLGTLLVALLHSKLEQSSSLLSYSEALHYL